MPGERTLRGFYVSCQQELFPEIELQYGSLSKRYKTLPHVFEIAGVHDFFFRPQVGFKGATLVFSGLACAGVSGQDGLEYTHDVRVA